jgi:hypothetical protein
MLERDQIAQARRKIGRIGFQVELLRLSMNDKTFHCLFLIMMLAQQPMFPVGTNGLDNRQFILSVPFVFSLRRRSRAYYNKSVE